MVYKEPEEVEEKEFKEGSIQKSYFEIESFDIENSKIYFNINTNYQNHSILCYVNYIRTKITDILNFSTNDIFEELILEIDNQKLSNKEKLSFYPLKLICKAQKLGTSYYKYANFKFNYTIPNKIGTIGISNDFLNIQEENLNLNKEFQINKDEIEKIFKPQINSDNLTTNYVSKNVETKENSIFVMLIGTSLLIGAFVLAW
jgi:competence CoiA-like predicted nuclease